MHLSDSAALALLFFAFLAVLVMTLVQNDNAKLNELVARLQAQVNALQRRPTEEQLAASVRETERLRNKLAALKRRMYAR